MPTNATFLGIDFAWHGEERPSGVALLKGDRHGASLSDVRVIPSKDVMAYVDKYAEEPVVVAIDAPLIVNNKLGQRLCEKLISKKYGARHGAAHTTNLSRFPDADSVRLAAELEAKGFRHAPEVSQKDKRVMLEVYPHPALLELFSRPMVINYKKGTVSERRRGQRELQRCLGELSCRTPLIISTPKLSAFLLTDTQVLRGAKLKENEDQLDSVLCAYIAFHYWFWRPSRTYAFGDVTNGYIIVPSPAQE